MSYDLAFWVGPVPASDEEAAEEFDRRAAFMEDEDVEFSPATPTMAAFIAELLSRFPALDENSDDENIWATGPEPGDINGDFAYLTSDLSGSGARIRLDHGDRAKAWARLLRPSELRPRLGV